LFILPHIWIWFPLFPQLFIPSHPSLPPNVPRVARPAAPTAWPAAAAAAPSAGPSAAASRCSAAGRTGRGTRHLGAARGERSATRWTKAPTADGKKRWGKILKE
jgi:hypothetical protein